MIVGLSMVDREIAIRSEFRSLLIEPDLTTINVPLKYWLVCAVSLSQLVDC